MIGVCCAYPDLDGDGDCNIFDVLLLRSNYGTRSGATWDMGDLDMDGDVDMYDFLIMRAHFGGRYVYESIEFKDTDGDGDIDYYDFYPELFIRDSGVQPD